MQQGNVMTEEPVKLHPYSRPLHPPADETEKEAPPPRLTLKYLHGLIETLQEEQRQLAGRVDELSRLLAGVNDQKAGHAIGQPPPCPSADWAVVQLPAAAAEGQPPSREDPPYVESILRELQEAARIADEIAEHAAAGDRPDARRHVQENPDGLPASPAPVTAAAPPSPFCAHDDPILVPRAERHHRHKRRRTFWSRLLGR